jgi:hypothetical protein
MYNIVVKKQQNQTSVVSPQHRCTTTLQHHRGTTPHQTPKRKSQWQFPMGF